jgi:hypothetical protein
MRSQASLVLAVLALFPRGRSRRPRHGRRDRLPAAPGREPRSEADGAHRIRPGRRAGDGAALFRDTGFPSVTRTCASSSLRGRARRLSCTSTALPRSAGARRCLRASSARSGRCSTRVRAAGCSPSRSPMRQTASSPTSESAGRAVSAWAPTPSTCSSRSVSSACERTCTSRHSWSSGWSASSLWSVIRPNRIALAGGATREDRGRSHRYPACVPEHRPPRRGGVAGGRTDADSEHGRVGRRLGELAFQWQRCEASGASCTSFPGATRERYVVGEADVGFRDPGPGLRSGRLRSRVGRVEPDLRRPGGHPADQRLASDDQGHAVRPARP